MPSTANTALNIDHPALPRRVANTVESLVAYGDLLELPTPDNPDEHLLYLAPPTFVQVAPGVTMLLGGQADSQEPLPSDLAGAVVHIAHSRRLYGKEGDDLLARLRAFGYMELPKNLWLRSPARETSATMVARAERALQPSPIQVEIPGLTILDPSRPPTFYVGRWTAPERRSGLFVARRKQFYRADLWSYVEIVDGRVIRLVDLPLGRQEPGARGCDDAWRLQLAIDAERGKPQLFSVRASGSIGYVVVDFFSPIPRWARRRWDVLGEEVAALRSLFAYRFPSAEFGTIRGELSDDLWMTLRESQDGKPAPTK